MKINYCLPVITSSKTEVLERIDKNLNNFSFFEIWLDYIQDPDNLFLESLASKLPGKLILVFRRQNLEPVKMLWKKREEVINFLNGKKILLDLDINDQIEEIKYISGRKLKVNTIISYHNYLSTPSGIELKKIIREMEKYNPDIYKISAFCQTESDAVRLLEIMLELKKLGLKFIILGMGKQGIITRIFGTVWGNQMIFAPVNPDEKSAPGQLTRSQIENVLKQLEIAN